MVVRFLRKRGDAFRYLVVERGQGRIGRMPNNNRAKNRAILKDGVVVVLNKLFSKSFWLENLVAQLFYKLNR